MEGLYTFSSGSQITVCVRSQTFLQHHFLENAKLMISKLVAIN